MSGRARGAGTARARRMDAIAGAWLAVAALAGAAPALAETVALTGGTVHTVSGPVLKNATVVIENGRIAAVGENLAPPAGARRVSVEGKHVYPGMISANTVLGLTEVNSVPGTNDVTETGSINPNIRAETQINPESEHIPVARVNGITSALVIPRGGVLTGTSALIHLDGWTYEDMTVKAPVALHIRWPAMSPTQSWRQRQSEEEQAKARNEALDELTKAFEDARAYWKARDAEGRRGVPRHDRDVKWDAMGKALKGEIPVVIAAGSLKQIRSALAFVDEQALPNVILSECDDARYVVKELKDRNITVMTQGMENLPRRSYEPYDAAFTLPAILHEAGVRFCITDRGSGGFNPMNTRNLPYHAALAAAFGLPREEALKAVTLYPAQLLGVADRIGSIEAGKVADLVVTDGDLLEVTTTVEQVWIGGRAMPMESRHTRLFEKYDGRPRGEMARPRDAGR